MLPEGWRSVLLDSVAKRGSGHTPSKDFPEYWNGSIKWVSLADSWRLDKGFIAETDKQISELGIANSSAVVHPAGTVVMSRDAGVGRSGVLARDMAVSQHFIAWDCSRSTELHNWYLYHWLQLEKPEFERIAVGSTIKTIGLPYFKGLQLLLPPIDQQRRVSEVLESWDTAIAVAEELLVNSRRQKLELMRELLSGRRRVSGHGHPWLRKGFNQVFERITQKNAAGNDNVLTISGRHGLINQKEFFSRSVASVNLESYTLLKRGDFAYNKSYSAGYPVGAIKQLSAYESGVVSSLYICFRLKADVGADADFYRHFFEAGLMNDAITGIAQEGARNHGLLNVGLKEFFALWLYVPEATEQSRIAKVLNTAEAEERCIERQLDRLKSEKRALMSDLLTGKRRVRLSASAPEALEPA